jgi:hypothetical protein
MLTHQPINKFGLALLFTNEHANTVCHKRSGVYGIVRRYALDFLNLCFVSFLLGFKFFNQI